VIANETEIFGLKIKFAVLGNEDGQGFKFKISGIHHCSTNVFKSLFSNLQ